MNIFFGKEFDELYAAHPITLVDVGSSGGLQSNWKESEKFLKIIGFDPDLRSYVRGSENSKYINLECGLHNRTGEADFYLTRSKTKSSLMPPNFEFLSKFPKSDFYEVIDKTKIKCDTLDNQLEHLGVLNVDFIKLDTQGSELHILEGARNTLASSVFGIEVEVEFSSMYENQPLFPDVDIFMRKLSFQLFDLAPCYWKRKIGRPLGGPQGQLIYADALYLRDSAAFSRVADLLADSRLKKSKILRALSICMLYGYFDYALELFRMNKDLFSLAEAESVEFYIIDNGHKYQRCLKFTGQKMISDLIYKIWKTVRPREYNWKKYIFKPGNRGYESILE